MATCKGKADFVCHRSMYFFFEVWQNQIEVIDFISGA